MSNNTRIIILDPSTITQDPEEQQKLVKYIDAIIETSDRKSDVMNTVSGYIDTESEIFIKNFIEAYINTKRAYVIAIMNALKAFGKEAEMQDSINHNGLDVKTISYSFYDNYKTATLVL